MNKFTQIIITRKPFQLVSVLCLTLALFLTGCGGSEDPRQSSSKTKPQNSSSATTKPLNNVLHSLYSVKNRYAETKTANNKSLQTFLRNARGEWNTIAPTVKAMKPNQFIKSVQSQFDELDASLRAGASVERIDALADSLIHTLAILRTSQLEETRRGVVRSIRTADRDITAETTAGNYRVGIALTEPMAIYDTSDIASAAKEASHQLRIVFREKQTKRKLAGSKISVAVLGKDGDTLQAFNLLETWGEYHFYGKNINLPEEAASVRVNISPPLIGRHEDEKDLYTKSVNANFPLSTDTDTRNFRYRPPTTVDNGTRLGSDVTMAYEETLDIQSDDPYRIGFIAEDAEPFWVVERLTDNSSLALRKADVPQSANRHLEITLFTQDYRIVPHAEVSISVSAKKTIAKAQLQLPFLMSTFNHYGNSLYLPKANYSINARVIKPAIHTLERNAFPEVATAKFNWNADK